MYLQSPLPGTINEKKDKKRNLLISIGRGKMWYVPVRNRRSPQLPTLVKKPVNFGTTGISKAETEKSFFSKRDG